MELHPIIIADDRCHRNHVLDRSWWLGSGWSHAKTTAHTFSGHGVRDHPWRYRPDRSHTDRLGHHLPGDLRAPAAGAPSVRGSDAGVAGRTAGAVAGPDAPPRGPRAGHVCRLGPLRGPCPLLLIVEGGLGSEA